MLVINKRLRPRYGKGQLIYSSRSDTSCDVYSAQCNLFINMAILILEGTSIQCLLTLDVQALDDARNMSTSLYLPHQIRSMLGVIIQEVMGF